MSLNNRLLEIFADFRTVRTLAKAITELTIKLTATNVQLICHDLPQLRNAAIRD